MEQSEHKLLAELIAREQSDRSNLNDGGKKR